METETILSIDATGPTIRAVLAEGNGTDMVVKDAFSVDGSDWWNTYFRNKSGTTKDSPHDGTEDAPNGAANPEAMGTALASGAPGTAKEEVLPAPSKGKGRFPLEAILNRIPITHFDESLIVLPPHQAMALHLELPFSQKASLSRIAPLEAQDKLPFSVQSFHCNAHTLRKLSANLFDIQVDLYPDKILADLISTCKELQFEPSLITIPPGLGELCHTLYPKYISKECLLVFRSAIGYSVAVLIDGDPVGYFTVPLETHTGPLETHSGHQFPGPSSLNICIAAIEERFSTKIERVYFIGPEGDFAAWKDGVIIRQSEYLQFEDLIPNCSNGDGLPTLAATAFNGEGRAPVVPNYRTGKYVFRPQLRNLLEGARKLLKPFLVVLVAFLLVLPVRYLAREYRIQELSGELHSAFTTAFPKANVIAGDELPTIRRKLVEVRAALQELGTAGALAPHKELALMLDTLKKFENLTLRRINILAEKSVIEGTANSYSDAEKAEVQFRALSDTYCKVELNTPSGRRSGQQQFDLELKKVCEE